MKNKKSLSNRAGLLVMASVFALIGIAVLVAVSVSVYRSWRLLDQGVITSGWVEKISCGSQKSSSCSASIGYRDAQGGTDSFRVDDSRASPDFREGSAVDVIYLPNQPWRETDPRIYRFSSLWLFPVAGTVFGLPFLAGGVFLAYTVLMPIWLRRKKKMGKGR